MIYGRSIRHLVIVWIVAVAALLVLAAFESAAPAFHELLIPFYWIILAVAGLLTWQWLRARGPMDRRGRDRRRTSRRENEDESQDAAPLEPDE